ncbi:hypothetical protein [Priestia sp. TGN 0903]|uniref:hypothetical protein n=1 Tax=Priestia sp. TGN 0903 TaxID=3420730 RepID=UPI003D770E5D
MNFLPEIRSGFFNILSSRPRAAKFVTELEKQGELLLFGGCVRDYIEHKFSIMPRDFDIIINNNSNIDLSYFNTKEYNLRKNKFGGYKFYIDGLKFDVWHIKNTWAFKESKVDFEDVNDLAKTVFLNIDALFYNLTTGYLFDEIYENTIKQKVLDIVLQENPYPDLNITRAFKFKQKYNLKFSDELNLYLRKWLEHHDNYVDAINSLKVIEHKRYHEANIDWNKETRDLKLQSAREENMLVVQ